MTKLIQPLDEGFGFGAEKITRYALDFAREAHIHYENQVRHQPFRSFPYQPKPTHKKKGKEKTPFPERKTNQAHLFSPPVERRETEGSFRLRAASPLGRPIKNQTSPSKKKNQSPSSVRLSAPHRKQILIWIPFGGLVLNVLHLMSCLLLILWGAQEAITSPWFHEVNEWMFFSQERWLLSPGLDFFANLIKGFGLQNFTLLSLSVIFFLFYLVFPQTVSYIFRKKSLGSEICFWLNQILKPFFQILESIKNQIFGFKWKS